MNDTPNTEQKPADGSPLDGGVGPPVASLQEQCPHDKGIATWRYRDGAPAGMWSCTQCALKFVPLDLSAEAALANLRAFANAVLGGWPDDVCLDGFELQDHAVKHGLLALKDPRPTAPCGEFCNCVEYHGSDPADWAAGVDCYFKTDLLGHNDRLSG